jgi:hypothetical protein
LSPSDRGSDALPNSGGKPCGGEQARKCALTAIRLIVEKWASALTEKQAKLAGDRPDWVSQAH